jgi:nitrogen fixation/metabolism regulation signal transduction histidine kinase
VFDDISDVISAQRSVAWGEVARRLAHEIKNPLTPIQLSAERLQMKLSDKLAPPDADVLKRGATMIVNQVAAMKRMVDDFRDYARLPVPEVEPLDLNLIHYPELHVHGANSSVQRDYVEACALIGSGKVNADRLVTHTFPLADFNKAVAVQGDPASGALKVIVKP